MHAQGTELTRAQDIEVFSMIQSLKVCCRNQMVMTSSMMTSSSLKILHASPENSTAALAQDALLRSLCDS
jgi:hypothetical protein